MKQCSRCKTEKEESSFYRNPRTKDGLTYYCKQCRKEQQKSYNATEKGKLVYKRNNEKDWTDPKSLYSRAKAYCKQKEQVFLLTFEEYTALYKQPCYYCNNSLCGNVIKKGISLDRIDNGRGYEIDNVLPCGGFCNKTRGDRLSVKEMLDVAQFIISLRNSGA